MVTMEGVHSFLALDSMEIGIKRLAVCEEGISGR